MTAQLHLNIMKFPVLLLTTTFIALPLGIAAPVSKPGGFGL